MAYCSLIHIPHLQSTCFVSKSRKIWRKSAELILCQLLWSRSKARISLKILSRITAYWLKNLQLALFFDSSMTIDSVANAQSFLMKAFQEAESIQRPGLGSEEGRQNNYLFVIPSTFFQPHIIKPIVIVLRICFHFCLVLEPPLTHYHFLQCIALYELASIYFCRLLPCLFLANVGNKF